MASTTAEQIVEKVGGPGNITSLTHCATRLRFELKDAGVVDQKALEAIPGVMGAVPQSGDRYQVVIGGAVASVYADITHLPSMAGAKAAPSDADVKAAERAKVRGKVAWARRGRRRGPGAPGRHRGVAVGLGLRACSCSGTRKRS